PCSDELPARKHENAGPCPYEGGEHAQRVIAAFCCKNRRDQDRNGERTEIAKDIDYPVRDPKWQLTTPVTDNEIAMPRCDHWLNSGDSFLWRGRSGLCRATDQIGNESGNKPRESEETHSAQDVSAEENSIVLRRESGGNADQCVHKTNDRTDLEPS